MVARLTLLLLTLAAGQLRAGDPLADWLARHHDRVPLTEDDPGGLFADATLNGARVRLQIDSGAGDLFLSEHLARRLGLATRPGGYAAGIGGKRPCAWTRINRLALAHGPPLTGIRAGVLSLDHLHQAGPHDGRLVADGLLGHPQLAAWRALVDYRAPALWLPRARAPEPDDAAVLRVPLDRGPGGLPAVNARHRGRTLRLVVDTGADRTLLTPAAAQRLGLNPQPFPAPARGVFQGNLTVRQCRLDELDLGPVALTRMNALVLDLGDAFDDPAANLDGILGADALDSLNAALDCGARRLLIAR